MRKCFLLAASFLIIGHVNAQAPRYAFFEEFTQASCGPCASQNPGFEANILEANPATVREIAIHTSWPGVDPMYDYNTAMSNDLVNYYGVTGVPDAFLLGSTENSPGLFTQADVDNVVSQTSPLKIRVSDVDNGSTHTVTVTVESWGTPPSGSNWKLRTAIIERNVNYTTPPGTNGEKYFPNVLREMLPNTGGDPITFAPMGSSVTFSYVYNEDPIWDENEVAAVAFVQNDDNKAIENCGASFDPDASIAEPAVLTHGGSVGSASTFDVSASNYGLTTENFKFKLTNNAPADWMGSFTVNGNTYTDSGVVSIAAGASATATISVTPGATAAIGAYTLTITNEDDANDDPVSKTFYVFRGITDLVVNAAGAQGDGSGVKPDSWDANFVNGLVNAGCTTSGVIGAGIAERASTENSLADVQDIYYNVGWSFPAFSDSWVAQLEALMNNGVNLFISGQDIGWDTWTDPASYGHATQASQDFYTDYLNAGFLDDGDGSNSSLTAVAADPVFGTTGTLSLLHYYGGTYFYPDEIEPVGNGVSVYTYATSTRVGAVRSDNGTYKTVYLAPGLEMLASTNSDKVMLATYNWFHGVTGVDELDQAFQSLGENYPNPGNAYTIVPVNNLKNTATFSLTNSIGQVVYEQQVNPGTEYLQLNTSGLPQGVYHYTLNDAGFVQSHAMVIIH